MPIDYKNYATNWKSEIRPAILKRANGKCELCNLIDHIEGYRDNNGDFISVKQIALKLLEGYNYFENELDNIKIDQKPIRIILTIAHLNHDVKNNDPENLKALCQKCHINHDKHYHKSNRRKNEAKKRGIEQDNSFEFNFIVDQN
ncbi:MAG: hypothetical protein ABI851_12105 [Saprospiraceae bacterium]